MRSSSFSSLKIIGHFGRPAKLFPNVLRALDLFCVSISLNMNDIRATARIGFSELLPEHNANVIYLQETRVQGGLGWDELDCEGRFLKA